MFYYKNECMAINIFLSLLCMSSYLKKAIVVNYNNLHNHLQRTNISFHLCMDVM